jgi:hypothetical protein
MAFPVHFSGAWHTWYPYRQHCTIAANPAADENEHIFMVTCS